MLRPIGQFNSFVTTKTNLDHPNFTGSNPNFNPLWDGVTVGAGQWDVDNDGDGVPDSVWVDLGMPVRTTSDGRLYKPLFAILCTDLDGRLNVNAHGCPGQTVTTTIANALAALPGSHAFAGGTPADLPRGLGYAPSEIDMSALFGIAGRNQLVTSRYPASGPIGGGCRAPDEPQQVVLVRRWRLLERFYLGNYE